jgi:plasmid stabilization system protein ParE
VKVEILEAAQKEISEAIEDYETKEPGLGLRFKEEVRRTIWWIAKNPVMPRVHPKGYRRVNLKVFRHYIAYFIWAETIWIVAVAHGHRRPEYWLPRKS